MVEIRSEHLAPDLRIEAARHPPDTTLDDRTLVVVVVGRRTAVLDRSQDFREDLGPELAAHLHEELVAAVAE